MLSRPRTMVCSLQWPTHASPTGCAQSKCHYFDRFMSLRPRVNQNPWFAIDLVSHSGFCRAFQFCFGYPGLEAQCQPRVGYIVAAGELITPGRGIHPISVTVVHFTAAFLRLCCTDALSLLTRTFWCTNYI